MIEIKQHFLQNQISMMKLLFSHISSQRISPFIKQLSLACFILLGAISANGQNFGLTECICQNNNSPQDPGLFTETIRITNGSAGPWTIESAYNIYDVSSTPGALVSFTPGTVIPELAPGVFQIEAEREDNTRWILVISDGTNSYPLEAIHLCKYPGPVLLGDKGVCIESVDEYSIDADASLLSGINWNVIGGTLLSANGGKSIDVEWGSTTGLATVSVTATARAFSGQGTQGRCFVNLSEDIPITSEDTVSMACNNLLNISMNNQCELSITPDMILEDQTYPNYSYEIRIRDIEQDTIIPNGVIKMDYLNKRVEVAIIHECSGNSCWGYVKLEDKNIPSLVCKPDITIDCDEITTPDETGFPLPDDVTVTQIRDGVYTVVGFDKCTELTMRYEDIVESVHCTGDFSSVISRFWSIMDPSGNVDTCSSKIFINKATLASITFPENYDDNTGPNGTIAACSNYPQLPNGNPDPYAVGGTGAPEGMFCLNVLVDYEDTRIEICNKSAVSFKLRRKWSVTDLCSGDQETRTQFITVMDQQPPIFTAPNEFDVYTEGLTCGGDIDVPAPILINECSEWDYIVSYKIRDDSPEGFTKATTAGVIRNADKTYTITNINPGSDSVWIRYTLTDACGNVAEGSTEAAIIDKLPPVPVCDQNSFVGLNDQGIAWAGVETFDDGSHDNCAIGKLEIRRMSMSQCTNDPLVWSEKLKFCCADVGVETMVSLRVTDVAGNSNTCMVLVTVQDNQDPELENCPGPRTVNCDADVVNLKNYGFPTVTDLCGATIEEVPPFRNIDNCGKGIIIRTFVATDNSGNTASCSQTITVAATNPFRASDIRWPRDYTVTNGCMDSGTAPDDLPSTSQRPTYPSKPCSNVTHDYKDIVFQFTDGACFKILREWTVLDWCAFNGVTGEGLYKHTQVIKVMNNIAPSVVVGCNDADVEISDLGDCRSRIMMLAEGEDDCSLPSSLRWNYKLDVGNDGTVDFDVNSNRIDRIVDHGTFRVTWTVTDECDNSSSCSKVFEVMDTKKPTPYCLSEIVTVIMEDTKEVEIWASDFDRNSFDNCTPQADLEFSFSTDIDDKFAKYTCADLTDGLLEQDLPIYVTDAMGNSDFCLVSIVVQDNSGACEEPVTRVTVGGKITNESNDVIENVDVHLAANLSEFPKVANLDNEGDYLFEDLIMYTDYTLDPVKEGDYLDGVSTLDLVMIQRHILAISPLSSAYKVIAADVNGDNKVSASDLVELRKLILGIYSELPTGESWRFIDKSKTFINPTKPFPYTSDMVMEQLDHNEMGVDFIALKVGDVNNSHKSGLRDNESDNRSQKEWTMEQNTVNGLTQFSIIIDEKALAGFQFAIEFDPSLYKFEGIEANQIDLNSSHLGLSQMDEGKILVSWSSVSDFDVEGNLLTLLLSNLSNDNAAITINPGVLSPEAYTVNGDVNTHKISFRSETEGLANGDFELFQNIPNPFDNTTKIGFNLQRESNVSLKIFDYSGKTILVKNGRYAKGYNYIDLNVNELSASGVLYYQIDTETNSASKKMIVIK